MAANLTVKDVKEGMDLPVLEKAVKPVTVVLGAMASRDWRPQHHDFKFATGNNGLDDIIMNTPNLAAWFERYLTDWTGPSGRLGRMKFRMRDSVFPGDRMVFRGTVEQAGRDEAGCAFVEVAVKLAVGERVCTECAARIAIPAQAGDNPWKRTGADWRP